MNENPVSNLRRSSHRALRGGVALAVLAAVSLFGQQTLVGPVKDFKTPEYYPAPNQNQLKWLCTGSNAVAQGSLSRVLVSQVKLETFKVTGERDLLLQADSCLFDGTRRLAYSDGPIKVLAAQGQVLIEGTGFLWQGTNSSITISNRIHTVIKRAPLAGRTDKP